MTAALQGSGPWRRTMCPYLFMVLAAGHRGRGVCWPQPLMYGPKAHLFPRSSSVSRCTRRLDTLHSIPARTRTRRPWRPRRFLCEALVPASSRGPSRPHAEPWRAARAHATDSLAQPRDGSQRPFAARPLPDPFLPDPFLMQQRHVLVAYVACRHLASSESIP